MSGKNQKTIEREKARAKEKQEKDAHVVKMRFKEDKFYNDFTIPEFEKGKVYELRGADWIARWLKRGGEIVEGELPGVEAKQNPSVIVPNKYSEKNPFKGEEEKSEEKEPVKREDSEESEDEEESE